MLVLIGVVGSDSGEQDLFRGGRRRLGSRSRGARGREVGFEKLHEVVEGKLFLCLQPVEQRLQHVHVLPPPLVLLFRLLLDRAGLDGLLALHRFLVPVLRAHVGGLEADGELDGVLEVLARGLRELEALEEDHADPAARDRFVQGVEVSRREEGNLLEVVERVPQRFDVEHFLFQQSFVHLRVSVSDQELPLRMAAVDGSAFQQLCKILLCLHVWIQLHAAQRRLLRVLEFVG
mmetsp:Transcript_9793/g.23281  ORF Transcript_9793/g.23281 Transcript_9793/m.23281 type:complete len:233 (+) Transcript_9793:669-1367(+)